MKKQYDPKKVDTWALGILLYRILFDKYPYRGRFERDMLEKIHSAPLSLPAGTGKSLACLLKGMLARDPMHRMTMLDII